MFFNNDPNKQYNKSLLKMDDKQLLSQFRNDNFSILKSPQKISLLQELENREAKSQGRTPADIIREPDPISYDFDTGEAVGNYGSHFSRYNGQECDIICIDLEQNPYEILDTYYHESRHSLQDHAVKTGEGLDKDTIQMCAIEKGVSYIGTYDLRTSEIDANVTATQKVLEHKELYQEDPKYYHYLKGREQHYDRVLNKNNQNPELRKNEILTKADNASMLGKISSEECRVIK